jgi:spermidine/putrescine transport system ATP-binding protein
MTEGAHPGSLEADVTGQDSGAAAPLSAAPPPDEADAGTILRLDRVRKAFGTFEAVAGIDLAIRPGEFFTIVGPSGSGKTTLLRMLAGLEAPTSGAILLRGRDIGPLPPARRPTCLVFQSLALFPHMTVGQNIEFAPKMKGVAGAARKARALELMRLMRLPEGYYGRNVMTCSGGEKQRVALARAFAYDPEILFFDEPLSALDYKLRKTLEKELKDIHRATGKTFVYITHSLEEAMVMSDRIGVMRAGHMVQVGTPEDIYLRPRDRFTAEFMGEVNVFAVRRRADGLYDAEGAPAPVRLKAGAPEAGFAVVRPEFMRVLRGPGEAENTLDGALVNEYALGSRMQYRIEAGGRMLVVESTRLQATGLRPGDPVQIGWNAADAFVVPE